MMRLWLQITKSLRSPPFFSRLLTLLTFYFRYVIVDSLGSGTFGQVVKCTLEGSPTFYAIKVIKNRDAYFNQARVEIDILQKVSVLSTLSPLLALRSSIFLLFIFAVELRL